MVNPKAQACDARNYFFLSSFDFTAEGVKLVKTRFEHELKEIAEYSHIKYNREKHTFHIQLQHLVSFDKVFIPFLAIVNNIIKDNTDPHDPYSEEPLEGNRYIQRITHIKSKTRLPDKDKFSYPVGIRQFQHCQIWHCNDEQLRLDHMISDECLFRLMEIGNGNVALEKDLNEQVVFVGAKTETLADSMINKLNVIRKYWMVIGNHIATEVLHSIYTEGDYRGHVSLVSITSTMKIAHTTLIDRVKYIRIGDKSSYGWLDNRFTVRYCPYHDGRNEYIMTLPARPKQLAIDAKEPSKEPIFLNQRKTPYIYQGHGSQLPDRSANRLPDDTGDLWKQADPQASARDKVDSWNAGLNAGMVSPNMDHHQLLPEISSSGYGTSQCYSQSDGDDIISQEHIQQLESSYYSEPILRVDTEINIEMKDTKAEQGKQAQNNEYDYDMLSLIAEPNSSAHMSDLAGLNIGTGIQDLRGLTFNVKETDERTSLDRDEPGLEKSTICEDDRSDDSSFSAEYMDALQSPVRSPIRTRSPTMSKKPSSPIHNNEHAPSATSTLLSPRIKEAQETGPKYDTMRQGGRKAKKTIDSSISLFNDHAYPSLQKSSPQNISEPTLTKQRRVSNGEFANDVSRRLTMLVPNMRNYDGLCIIEARIGRVIVDNVNPLQVAEDSTHRHVPPDRMVDYLQGPSSADFTPILTQIPEEINDIMQRSTDPSWQTGPISKVSYEIIAMSKQYQQSFVVELDAESFDAAVYRQEIFAEMNIHCTLRNWDVQVRTGGREDMKARYKGFVDELVRSTHIEPGRETPMLEFEYSGAHEIGIVSIRLHHTSSFISTDNKSTLHITEITRLNLERSFASQDLLRASFNPGTIDTNSTVSIVRALPILEAEAVTLGYPAKWYEMSVTSTHIDAVFNETTRVELGDETTRGESFEDHIESVWRPAIEIVKLSEYLGFNNENGLEVQPSTDGGRSSLVPTSSQGSRVLSGKPATLDDAHFW